MQVLDQTRYVLSWRAGVNLLSLRGTKQSRIFSKKLICYRLIGEVAEWPKAVDSKSAGRREVSRGFESHPLRHESYIVARISYVVSSPLRGED